MAYNTNEQQSFSKGKGVQPMKKIKKLLPGLLLCIAIMLLGIWLTNLLGQGINRLQGLPEDSASPISSIFVAILLGLLIRNTLGLQDRFKAGVSFSTKFILRMGIMLIGIRLSLIDLFKLGAWGIPVIVACITTGLVISLWIAKKLNQSERMGTLIAVGTGICGVTAIMGTAPGIKANEEEVAYSVANVTLFGLVTMFIFPYLAAFLFEHDPIKIGLFLGTAIHDTSQVMGASLMYEQTFGLSQAVDVAAITKLTRNFFLVAVVPLASYIYYKKISKQEEGSFSSPKWYSLIPFFVIGFVTMSCVRTIGDAGLASGGLAYGLFHPLLWQEICSFISKLGSIYLLGTAMAGVGLSTSFRVFKGLGIKPFYIGMAAALSVSVVSLLMVYLLGDYIILE